MEISEIKARLSIQTVLKHYGLQPDRNNMLKCPFHADDKPSLKIYSNTNTFNCFGCGKSGDQIEFCTLKEGNKHKGLLKATELTGEITPINNKPKQQKCQPKENHTGILTKIFESFRNGLNHPVSVKPKEYLKSRNLNHELLEIGYNSGQFHHRGGLSETDKQACIHAGLLIPYNGSVPNANGTNRHGGQAYTAFAKDCIIFPLKDKSGNIVSLYGRSIIHSTDRACPVSTGKHYYLKDRQGLYPGYLPVGGHGPELATTKLILTEAIINAATLLQIPEITSQYSVLACYGINGLTSEHLQAIKELQNLQEIIFFFDGDKAGTEAIKKYQEELLNELPGVKLTAIETPEGEDINSLSVAYDTEIFTHLLENRKSFLLTEKTEEPKRESQPEEKTHGRAFQADRLNTANPPARRSLLFCSA